MPDILFAYSGSATFARRCTRCANCRAAARSWRRWPRATRSRASTATWPATRSTSRCSRSRAGSWWSRTARRPTTSTSWVRRACGRGTRGATRAAPTSSASSSSFPSRPRCSAWASPSRCSALITSRFMLRDRPRRSPRWPGPTLVSRVLYC